MHSYPLYFVITCIAAAPYISFWVNWVFTQPGYPQLCTCKNNCVFSYFFTPRFFFCDYTFSYWMKPSGLCLHIYSLPSSAFLKNQTRGFYCTWSKSHPLVDIPACLLCKVSLSSLCFSAKYWTGHRYFHKTGVYCALASKNKINTWLAFVY